MQPKYSKEWNETLILPNWMVIRIVDIGMEEQYIDGNIVDRNDLRMAIEILGGYKIVLPPNSRIVINDKGDFIIELLRNVNDFYHKED